MQKTILIVENSDSDRQQLALMVEKLGFKSMLCADGLGILARLKENHASVALILLNLSIPDIDGISVLGHCRGHYPDLPVILISGTQDEDDIRQARKLGVDEWIAKPFELSGVDSSMRKALSPEKRHPLPANE